MAVLLSNRWKDHMMQRMDQALPIDETTGCNVAIRWLIINLSSRGTPFKLHNLGAGVKRVTTDTDTCPCCKRKL